MEVLKIEELDNCVQVALKDGSTIRGDILIGADGVHSRTRTEMWRLADLEDPDYGAARMRKCMIVSFGHLWTMLILPFSAIASTYKCMFGIAQRPDDIPKDKTYKAFFEGRSYLCPMGPDNKAYFFAFFKNPETKFHHDIPRYTEDESKELAALYANDHIFDGYTFGDIYERRMSSVLVPIEEFVLEKCSYKRAVLIGDSYHKVPTHDPTKKDETTNLPHLMTGESTDRTRWKCCSRVRSILLRSSEGSTQ